MPVNVTYVVICLPSSLRSWLCVLTLNSWKTITFQRMPKKERSAFLTPVEATV